MARKSALVPLLQLLSPYLLKKAKIKVVGSSFSTLTKRFLLFLIEHAHDEDIESKEREWLKKHNLSSYKIKELRRKTKNFLTTLLEEYFFGQYNYFANHTRNIILDSFSVIMLGKDEVGLFTCENKMEDIINDVRWLAFPEWLLLSVFYSFYRIKFNSFEDMENTLDQIKRYIISEMEGLKSMYLIYTLRHIPFVEIDEIISEKDVVTKLLNTLLNNRNTIYDNFHDAYVLIDALPLLSWLQLTNSLSYIANKILEFLKQIMEDKPNLFEHLMSDGSYNPVLSHILRYIYGIVYVNGRDYMYDVSRIKKLLKLIATSVRESGPSIFNLQLMHVLLEGARWSLLKGEVSLYTELRSIAEHYSPPKRPRYFYRITYHLDLLEALITMPDSHEFLKRIEAYRKNPHMFPPAPFVTLLASNIAEMVYYINTKDVEGTMKMGERIYQLCYRNNKAKSLGKIIRNMSSQMWGARPISFWRKTYSEIREAYAENPFYFALESFFPFLAWVIHKANMEPLKDVLQRDYIAEAGFTKEAIEIKVKELTGIELPNNWKVNFDKAIEAAKTEFSKL